MFPATELQRQVCFYFYSIVPFFLVILLASRNAVVLPFLDLLLYNGSNLVWGASIQAYGHNFHCC
jgi:hypothetical protein